MKSGGKKVLILSIIELVIHGALLGLGAYFVFTEIFTIDYSRHTVVDESKFVNIVKFIGRRFSSSSIEFECQWHLIQHWLGNFARKFRK